MPRNDKWAIIQSGALNLLGDLSPGTFDATITDPPYASGGALRRRRTSPPLFTELSRPRKGKAPDQPIRSFTILLFALVILLQQIDYSFDQA